MPWLFFLKARAEVESADHLYPVEDGFRKQYADFGGETESQRVNKSTSRRALALAYAIVIAIANTPPQSLLNESSSLLIACDGSPKKSYCKITVFPARME